VLRQAFREGWPAVAAAAEAQGGLPRRVREEVRRYLECGVLRHGFTAARCGACGEVVLIAFWCKSRGWCPSCAAKRAHKASAHLLEVLPEVGYRQWTLSLPRALNFLVVKEVKLLRRVERELVRAIGRWQRRRARMLGARGKLVTEGVFEGSDFFAVPLAWAAEAAKNPQDTENFTPLFLLGMAQQRAPGVDFFAGSVSPEQIRLGMLELVLFVAAFDRLVPSQSGLDSSGVHLASLSSVVNSSTAAQISPCKPFQDTLFGQLAYSDVGNFLLQWISGKALEQGLNAAGISEWGQAKVGKAMFALGVFMPVLRAALVATYVAMRVKVEGDQSVHKPLEGEQLLKSFHAWIGIPPEDWQTYKEQFGKGFHDTLRECMSWLGVSSYTLDDLVGEMGSWAVEWKITIRYPRTCPLGA